MKSVERMDGDWSCEKLQIWKNCPGRELSLIWSLARFVYVHGHLGSERSTRIDEHCKSECAQIGRWSVVSRLSSVTSSSGIG